jgi:hypothetical protein
LPHPSAYVDHKSVPSSPPSSPPPLLLSMSTPSPFLVHPWYRYPLRLFSLPTASLHHLASIQPPSAASATHPPTCASAPPPGSIPSISLPRTSLPTHTSTTTATLTATSHHPFVFHHHHQSPHHTARHHLLLIGIAVCVLRQQEHNARLVIFRCVRG